MKESKHIKELEKGSEVQLYYTEEVNNMSLESISRELIGTTYKHFKGNEYQITDIARDCEDSEVVIVYQNVANPHGRWVRKLNEFFSYISRDGYFGPRFTYIEEHDINEPNM